MSAKFDLHRTQLVESLNAVADTMRNCAQIAESFAKIVKNSDYSQDVADSLNDDHSKGKRRAASSPDDPDAPKKRKRNTKPKDPNAPKRPASSYILFQNQVRKELKEKHPELSNSDLLGFISDQWKNMSEEQKETYNQAMKTAKAQYSEEKKAYDNRTPEEIEAANAAMAAAATLKKANSKPRGPKPGAAAASAATPAPAVKVRPPPTADEVSPSSDSSDSDDSEEEEAAPPMKHIDSDSSDDDSDRAHNVKKRRVVASPAPIPKEKAKKSSKA